MDGIFLLVIIIIAPFLIPFLLVFIKYGEGERLSSKVISVFGLNAEKGLAQQGILWLCILVPLLYFLVLGCIIWSEYSISVNKEGFLKFAEISTFPLAVLSLSLPLSVLVTRLHSTMQTAEQISILKRKQNAEEFYAHRDQLFQYFSQIDEVLYHKHLKAKFKVNPKLHKRFFVGSHETGMPLRNETRFHDVNWRIVNLKQMLGTVIQNSYKNDDETLKTYLIASASIFDLAEDLFLVELRTFLLQKSIKVVLEVAPSCNEQFLTAGTETVHVIVAYRYLRAYFEYLCEYSGYRLQQWDTLDSGFMYSGEQYLNVNRFLVIESLHATKIKNIKVRDQDGI
ncbi:hypothetical protein [Hahella sp. HN01]|uniref:hypothetical protein n=1 Tax=Hahella sp. HN01 TaxID=2847262 RepID=UPI001C1EA1E9|nr:hypothetical protein [Hahella sp. HN01]MBU6951621.1 hypothetical protein [Hahella sp. HN01]